jgi:hypothetical protein
MEKGRKEVQRKEGSPKEEGRKEGRKSTGRKEGRKEGTEGRNDYLVFFPWPPTPLPPSLAVLPSLLPSGPLEGRKEGRKEGRREGRKRKGKLKIWCSAQVMTEFTRTRRNRNGKCQLKIIIPPPMPAHDEALA